MNEHDFFTRETAQKKLDRVEMRLKVAEVICKEIKGAPFNNHGYIDATVCVITVNSLLNKISSLLSSMTHEIQIDLHDLKTCLHHMHALPILNEKGELK